MSTLMPPDGAADAAAAVEPGAPQAADVRHLRWPMRVLAALALLSAIVLATLLTAPGSGNIVQLELAGTATRFDRLLRDGWLEDASGALCSQAAPINAAVGGTGCEFPTLRNNLLIDTLAFAPAYAGLLTLFTIALYRRRRPQGGLWMQVLCVSAAIALLCDIAENGMTMRAAEDAMNGLLADGTAADILAASLAKWCFAALAFALLGGLAWWVAGAGTPASGERWLLRAAGAAAVATALAFAAGAWGWPQLLNIGLALAFAGLGLLVAWQERLSRQLGASAQPHGPGR